MTGQLSDTEFHARYGPWAIIAGASEGTGSAFAHQLAAKGLNCVLVARRKELLEALSAELEGTYGIQTRTAVIDLSHEDAVQKMVAAAAGLEVGLYVSNAGGDPNASKFLDAPLDSWRALLARNCRTVLEACHTFAPAMKERGRGGILLMSSGASLGGAPYIAAYSATKAFDLVFAESLWAELGEHGIDVLGVAAPGMNTETFRSVLALNGLDTFPGILEPDDAVRIIIAHLHQGPVYVFAGGEDTPEAVNAARRASVEAKIPAMQYLYE